VKRLSLSAIMQKPVHLLVRESPKYPIHPRAGAVRAVVIAWRFL
jgi:hypothetical protein